MKSSRDTLWFVCVQFHYNNCPWGAKGDDKTKVHQQKKICFTLTLSSWSQILQGPWFNIRFGARGSSVIVVSQWCRQLFTTWLPSITLPNQIRHSYSVSSVDRILFTAWEQSIKPPKWIRYGDGFRSVHRHLVTTQTSEITPLDKAGVVILLAQLPDTLAQMKNLLWCIYKASGTDV